MKHRRAVLALAVAALATGSLGVGSAVVAGRPDSRLPVAALRPADFGCDGCTPREAAVREWAESLMLDRLRSVPAVEALRTTADGRAVLLTVAAASDARSACESAEPIFEDVRVGVGGAPIVATHPRYGGCRTLR